MSETNETEQLFGKALQVLVDLEMLVPCEVMSRIGDYCSENCVWHTPPKECWLRYLKREVRKNDV